MRVLVVVPAYNEESNIVQTIQQIKEIEHVDIVIINDNSKDNTSRLAKEQSGVMVLDLPCNLGIGGAVQTGYMYAAEHDYDIAIQIDGDGQHNPEFIGELIRPIVENGYDMVIGSRFIDKLGFQSTWARRIGIVYFQYLIQAFTKVKITDPTSGFRALSRRAINYFSRNYPVDYPEPEAIVHAYRIGLRLIEIPVIMKKREGGASSIYSLRTMYYMVKVTLAIMIAKMSKAIREV
jgi:glycosyltransferase involved in cell wall biosynthesis